MKTLITPVGQNSAITTETIAAMQESSTCLATALSNILTSAVANSWVIISGCTVVSGVLYAGVVSINGEIFEVESGVSTGKIELIEETLAITGVDLQGNQYTTNIVKKYCRPSATGTYILADFAKMEHLLSYKNYKSKSFDILSGVAGVTNKVAIANYTPYSVDIRARFDVEIAALTSGASPLYIDGFDLGDGAGHYPASAKGYCVGDYTISLMDLNNEIHERYKGDVVLDSVVLNRLFLHYPHGFYMPTQSISSGAAIIGSLNEGKGSSGTGIEYPKYRIELNARFINSSIGVYP